MISHDQIIKIADAHYPDGRVGECYEDGDAFAGDPLAEFVVSELDGLTVGCSSDIEALEEAADRIETGSSEIAAVAVAFRSEAQRRTEHARPAPRPRPVTFRRGEFVQCSNWRTTWYGKVVGASKKLGMLTPGKSVRVHLIEWADRTRSSVVLDYEEHQIPVMSAATEEEFETARRTYDRLIEVLSPGVRFLLRDTVTTGLLVVLQAPLAAVSMENSLWVGSYFFPVGDNSVDGPVNLPTPAGTLFVVAREIDTEKIRAVRIEPGVVEVSPASVVAAPYREGGDADTAGA